MASRAPVKNCQKPSTCIALTFLETCCGAGVTLSFVCVVVATATGAAVVVPGDAA